MFKKSALILLLACIFCQAMEMPQPASSSNLFRRILIMPDFDFQINGALEKTFMLTLVDQSTPLLIHHKVLQRFIEAKKSKYSAILKHKDGKKIIDGFNHLLNSPTGPNITQEVKNLVGNLGFGMQDSFVYYQIAPNSNEWLLYNCTNTSFVLLLPKKYARMLLPGSSFGNNQQSAAQLGLNITQFEPITLPEKTYNQEKITQEYAPIIKKLENKPDKFSIDFLNQIFLPNSPQYDLRWNIFEIGHGLIPEQEIAGMPLADFQKQLQFFNSVIKTNIFYYWTCYGGYEKHVTQPFMQFEGLNKLTYTVISGATTDLPVTVIWLRDNYDKPYRMTNDYLVPTLSLNFEDFFKAAEGNDTIETSISYLTTTNAKNIPLIRFPGTTWFSPTDLNKKVFVITRTKAFASLVNVKPMEVGSDKIAVIVVPEIVPSKVIMHNKPKEFEIIATSPSEYRFFSELAVDDIQALLQDNLFEKSKIGGSGAVTEKLIYCDKLSLPRVINPTIPKERISTQINIWDNDTRNDLTKEFLVGQQISLDKIVLEIPVIKPDAFTSEVNVYMKFNNKIYKGQLLFYKNQSRIEIDFKEINEPKITKTMERFSHYETEMAKLQQQAEAFRKIKPRS